MASLVEQIYMQAQGGSAGGAGFADFLVQGRQVNQRQQQIELQKQQVAAELAQLPLKQTLLQQDAQMNALKIEDELKARKLAIDNAFTIQTAWDLAGKEVNKGNLKGAFDVAFGMAGQSIGIVEDPKFKALTSHLTKLVELANQRAEIDARIPAANLGGVTVVTNPEDKSKAAFVRTGPNSLTPFPKVEDINAPQSPTGKLLADRNVAFKAGLTNDVKQYDAVLAKQAALDGFSLTTNPDGTINLTKGAQNALTPTNKTQVQQGLANSLASIDVTNRLEPLLDLDTVGVKAFAESWVKDRILAQAFPQMASDKRATAESLAAELRSTAVRDLKSDPNITEPERKQILRAVPEVNAPIDSPARAKRLNSGIRKMAAMRAVIGAFKLGEPIPKAAAVILDTDELERLSATGILTPEQALAVFDAR